MKDLQVWGGVDEAGNEYVLLAEATSDPTLQDDVERVRRVLREQGLTQLAGD